MTPRHRSHHGGRFLAIVMAAFLSTCGTGGSAPELTGAGSSETVSGPSIQTFWRELDDAVKRRDAAFLEAHLDPHVRLSFGGDGGVADFREKWQPRKPDSRLWSVLGEIVRLGGTFDKSGAFIAPVTFSAFPDDRDAFQSAVVVRPTTLYAKPDRGASPIAVLRDGILEIIRSAVPPFGGTEPDRWLHVRSDGGAEGYVWSRDVRSPLDYRLILNRVEGLWLIQAFVAGD